MVNLYPNGFTEAGHTIRSDSPRHTFLTREQTNHVRKLNPTKHLENQLLTGDFGKVHALGSMKFDDPGGSYGIIRGYSATECRLASAYSRASAGTPRALSRGSPAPDSAPTNKSELLNSTRAGAGVFR